MPDVPLKCRCGAFRAVLKDITPSSSNRVTCYCDDCQTFAHHCGAEDVLDAWGGTEVCQVSPKQLVLQQGELSLLKLSPKSGTYRWLTKCCSTPVGNTAPAVPFVGVIHTVIDADQAAMDEAFGPPCRTFNVKFATGNREALKQQQTTGGTLRSVMMVTGWWIRGHKRHHPLFPAGRPLVEPEVMPLETRRALLERCGPEPRVADPSA